MSSLSLPTPLTLFPPFLRPSFLPDKLECIEHIAFPDELECIVKGKLDEWREPSTRASVASFMLWKNVMLLSELRKFTF